MRGIAPPQQVLAHDEAHPVTATGSEGLRARLVEAQDTLRLWESLFDQSTEGIMICDARSHIVRVNAAFEELTGYKQEEVVGKTPRLLHSGRQDQTFYREVWRRINATGSWSGEVCNRRKTGDLYMEFLTIKRVCNQQGDVTHFVGIFSDLTDRKDAEERIRHLAEYDPLTELPNRALLIRRLQALCEQSNSVSDKLAVMYIDLDRFNDINDSIGHHAGDRLLQIVARRIATTVRHTDTVARLSADEFVVVLSALSKCDDAGELAELLLDAVRQPIELDGQEIAISASIGISMFPNDGTDAEDLIRNASAAMGRIKRERRNAYQFYTHELNDRAVVRLRTQNALRQAIERNELVLHFQPQISLASETVVGAEALIRWNRPGEGLWMPSQFIPLAEECGLILPIGDWVISESARQIRAWDELGVPPITVAVNISAIQCRQQGFVERIAREIHASRIQASRLELELTEANAVRDVEIAAEVFRRLHQLGVRLSLDDFGTGYSSLSYLGRLPIDKIKIDQSFIRQLAVQPDSIRIVRAIIALASGFALNVIAEGVETALQLSALRAEGCDEIQGYLASPPLPADEFLSFLRSWKRLP